MKENTQIKKTLAAKCGLYCGACALYIISREYPERLKAMAQKYQIAEEELKCEGCRSLNKCPYCASCTISKCIDQKGVEFCIECSEFPCENLTKFQSERPHRIELWKDLERIEKIGYEKWLDEVKKNYSCPSCQTINSAYDLKCRNCDHEPGNEYVRKHRSEIENNMLDL